MKRILSLLLVFTLCIGLCACASDGQVPDHTLNSTVTTMEETTIPETTVPNNGEWDEILCSGDDYHLVVKHIDTFDKYTLQLGVINSQGEWVQELTEKGAFVDMVIFRWLGSSETLSDSSCYMYLGEGVFLASPGVTVVTEHGECRIGPWENSVYTTFTGREKVSIWECLIWNVEDNIQTRFDASIISTLQNGHLFFCEQEPLGSGMLQTMNTKCEITELPCRYIPNGAIRTFPVYSDGLFYAYTEKRYDAGFFDIEGNLVVSMYDYNLSWRSYKRVTGKNAPYFENGQFTFLTVNEGGSVYKATIDKTGTIIGEPEKIDVPH